MQALFEGPDGPFWARYFPRTWSCVCTYVKSSWSQKLEVLSAKFPNSFPTPMNTTKSELVLTCFESLHQFRLYVDFSIFIYHRFFARVDLRPYCIHTWVGRPGPEHQRDVPAHRNLGSNCNNFRFSNPAGHYWGPRRPFLGSIFSAHVILRVHVCKIVQITKTRSPISLIPQ